MSISNNDSGPEYRGDFADNPCVYHIIVDRFSPPRPGLAANGRLDAPPKNLGAFHGGNLRGVIAKLNEDWFTRLGVNAIWISAPFEQIRGWVPGANAAFRHFAYHGYWTLDYTVLDQRFGSDTDLKDLVDAAHERGIKIILDVVMSHPGYPELQTMQELLPHAARSGWEYARPSVAEDDQDGIGSGFDDWWGRDWVRAQLPGYDEGNEDALAMPPYALPLPRFRTESEAHVAAPVFLKNKPGSKVVDLPGTTVRGYLIRWLTDWVRTYGIDGFRCDSVKHVDLRAWKELKAAAVDALLAWKADNPEKKIDDSPFWMTGEVYGNGIGSSAYYESGFDNLINFQFQEEVRAIFCGVDLTRDYPKSLAYFRLDKLYSRYAQQLAGRPGYNVISYISSHDTSLFDRTLLFEAGAALMLAPGGVQIFYGDESGRLPDYSPHGDPAQSTRSDMNWDEIDPELLAHWQKLGQFRGRHVAIAQGRHAMLCDEPYVFCRMDQQSGDCVVVALDHFGLIELQVPQGFRDGDMLQDAYTGQIVKVVGGRLRIQVSRLMLLERYVGDEIDEL